MRSRNILGVRVDLDMSMSDVIAKIDEKLRNPSPPEYICTTNPEFIMDAQINTGFKSIINNSYLSTPDGIGVLLADAYLSNVEAYKGAFKILYSLGLGFKTGLRALSGSYSHKTITGVDLTYKMCELARKKGYTVFLLGGRKRDKSGNASIDSEDMATRTASVLSSKYPGLKIVGASSGFSRDPSDDLRTVDYIRNSMKNAGVSHIDMLFVAYNHVYQEEWIVRNSIGIPAVLSVGVGGTFDYICGIQPEVPVFYKKSNLAWLFRLISSPWRFKRALKAFPSFPFKVFISSISS